MLAQPAPVATLIAALIDVECLSHSLAASRDDFDNFFPRGEPWPRTQRTLKEYLRACHGRSRPGDGPLDEEEAKQVWCEMMRDVKHWQSLRDGMLADYHRWAGRIEEAVAGLPKLHALLEGLVVRPLEWTSKLRARLYKVRSVVMAAGNRPWVIAAPLWTKHLRGVSDARAFLQAADFPGSTRLHKPAGWTKAELIGETGVNGHAAISPSMFDKIRKAAKVKGSTRGNQTWRYGRRELRLLIAAARSGGFPRKGPGSADAWSALLGSD